MGVKEALQSGEPIKMMDKKPFGNRIIVPGKQRDVDFFIESQEYIDQLLDIVRSHLFVVLRPESIDITLEDDDKRMEFAKETLGGHHIRGHDRQLKFATFMIEPNALFDIACGLIQQMFARFHEFDLSKENARNIIDSFSELSDEDHATYRERLRDAIESVVYKHKWQVGDVLAFGSGALHGSEELLHERDEDHPFPGHIHPEKEIITLSCVGCHDSNPKLIRTLFGEAKPPSACDYGSFGWDDFLQDIEKAQADWRPIET